MLAEGCNICSQALDNDNRSKAHSSLCKPCYAKVNKYKRLIKSNDLKPSQLEFIKRMEHLFAINDLQGLFVPKAYRIKKGLA